LFLHIKFQVYFKDGYEYFKVVFAIVGTALLFQLLLVVFTRFERIITVDTLQPYGSGSGRYNSVSNMVADKEGRVYKVQNVLLLLHFRAAEVQATLKAGQRFQVRGYGIRVPILGLYPTITGAVAQ